MIWLSFRYNDIDWYKEMSLATFNCIFATAIPKSLLMMTGCVMCNEFLVETRVATKILKGFGERLFKEFIIGCINRHLH